MTTKQAGTPPGGYVPSPVIAAWIAGHGGGWPRLYPADVAEVAGVSRHWIHQLHSRSRERRRTRKDPLIGDLPPESGVTRGQPGAPSPWWPPWEIDEWLARKPEPGWPARPSEPEPTNH